MSSLTTDWNMSTQCTSSPSLQFDTSTLSTQEVGALIDLVEEVTAPSFYLSPLSLAEDDSLHPRSPWVKVLAYSFEVLPLITRHFTTEDGH